MQELLLQVQNYQKSLKGNKNRTVVLMLSPYQITIDTNIPV